MTNLQDQTLKYLASLSDREKKMLEVRFDKKIDKIIEELKNNIKQQEKK